MTPRRLSLLTLLAAGCGQTPAPPAPTPVPVVVVTPGPAAVTPAPLPAPAPTPKPAASVPAPEPYRLPTDGGGQAVTAALRPNPLPVAATTIRTGPTPRAVSVEALGAATGPVKVSLRPTPVIPPPVGRAGSLKPAAPPERAPADLGVGAIDLTSFTMTARVTPPWRQPPPADPLALPPVPLTTTPKPERASTADPTADLAAMRVVFTPLFPVVLSRAAARFDLPDPFEFLGHLRGPVGSTAELGTKPVVVTPTLPAKP